MPLERNVGPRRLDRRESSARALSALPGPRSVEAEIPGDLVDPAPEAPGVESRPRPPKQGEKRLVKDVLRLGAVAEKAQHEPEERPLVALVQAVERGEIARGQPPQQRLVRIHPGGRNPEAGKIASPPGALPSFRPPPPSPSSRAAA